MFQSEIEISGVDKPVIWVGEKPTLSEVKKYISYANLFGHHIKLDKGFEILKFNLPIVNSESVSLAIQKVVAEKGETPFLAYPGGCCFVK